MLSHLRPSPDVGAPDITIRVEWQVGEDLIGVEGMTTDDELRLVTSSGVVVSRAPLRNGTFEGLSIQEVYARTVTSNPPNTSQADSLATAKSSLPRFKNGIVDIVCPPFAGGFVLCLVDGESFKRLLASPLRVAGATLQQRQTLNLDLFHLNPMDCLTVTYNVEEPRDGDLFAVVKSNLGDNTGLSVPGENPLSHCTAIYQASVVNTEEDLGQKMCLTTMSVVAPRTPGEYQVRLISTPKCGIPYTRCSSPSFHVRGFSEIDEGTSSFLALDRKQSTASSPVPEGLGTSKELYTTPSRGFGSRAEPKSTLVEGLKGEIHCSQYSLFVGQQVDVEFKFENNNCGAILSELDTVMFYPYGRSEEAVQGNGLATTVGEAKYGGKLSLTAPLTEGVYDLAYYSFSDQRPLLTETRPVRVEPAHARLEHHSEAAALEQLKVKAGKATGGSAAVHHVAVPTDGVVTLAYEIDCRIFSNKDRLIVHDELTNVVDSCFVDRPVDRKMLPPVDGGLAKEVFKGYATANLFIKGEHTVYYYSYVLKRKVARLAGFIEVSPPKSLSLPIANLTTLALLPADHEIHVGFVKQGQDSRPTELQNQDCVALYEMDTPDYVHTHTRDCGEGMSGAIQVHYLRGTVAKKIVFDALGSTTKIAARYLVAVNGHFHRVCTSETIISLRPRTDPSLKDFQFKPLHHVSLNDVAQVTHRLGLEQQKLPQQSEADPFDEEATTVSTSSTPAGGSTGAMVSRTNSGVSPALQRGLSQVSRKSNVSQAISGAPILSMRKPFKTQLHFTPAEESELKGRILPPNVANTTDMVIVTFNITEGLARGEDRVALVTDDLDRVVAECPVVHSQGRPDYSLGTVTLYPPKVAGRYLAVYFSDKYQSIVFSSETFRVVDGSGEEMSKATGITAYDRQKRQEALRGGVSPAGSRAGSRVARTIPSALSYSSSTTLATNRSPTPVANFSNMTSTSVSSTRKPRTKFLCICVGYLRRYYELKGPLNDAERLPVVLAKMAGIDLTNQEECRIYSELRSPLIHSTSPHWLPTAENIRHGIRWLIQGAQPKDQLILYFSGAGARLPSKTGEDGMENVLLPADFDWNSRMIPYSELADSLFGSVPHGTAVSAFVDTCFSTNPHDICGQWSIWREEGISAADDTDCSTNRPRFAGSMSATTALVQAQKTVRNQKAKEQENRGMAALWRRREIQGIPAKTPWRAIAPPRGMFSSMNTAPDDLKPESAATLGPLFQPYTASHTPPQQDGTNALFVLYEACRGTKHQPQGAWDVFVSDEGRSHGLFTSCLVTVLEEELRDEEQAGEEGERQNSSSGVSFSSAPGRGKEEHVAESPSLSWWEFHERVCRRIKKTPFGSSQLPRLLVGDLTALGTKVFHSQKEISL